MKHLIQYHNVASQGYDLQSAPARAGDAGPHDYYAVGTNKPLKNLLGSIVWCVSGKGSPRVYRLEYVFVVDDVVTDASGDALQTFVRGRDGFTFKKRPCLNNLPWFVDFRRSQGNFAFGLSTIRDVFVPSLLSFLPEGHPFR